MSRKKRPKYAKNSPKWLKPGAHRRKESRIDWDRIRWGSLTRWLLKHRNEIKRKYGDPFTRTGEINDRVLKKLYNDEELLKRLAGSHWKRVKRKIHFKLYVLKG